MKKLVIAASLFISMSAFAAPPEISEKVLDAFKTTFTNATDVSWDEMDDFYAVKFKNNNIDTRIRYDKQGNILQTTRYYYEQQLPLLIQAKLKKQYPTRKVFGVTEVSSESELSYYIILEDAKTWLTIKSDGFAHFDVYDKMKKA